MNPKEQCKAITLRRGKEIKEIKPHDSKATTSMPNQEEEKAKEEIQAKMTRESSKPKSISFHDNLLILKPSLSYRQKILKEKA